MFYKLSSIESFFSWIRNNSNAKVKDIENNTKAFIEILRSSLGNAVKSEVTFYEGIEGIKDSYRHILNNAKDEICAYFSVVESEQRELQSFFVHEYSPERARRKIFSRNIVPKTPKTTYFKLQSDELNMELRMVSKGFFPLINSEINLYGEYMHCMAFDENGGFAVIIQGDIVRLQKALFEIAWKTCNQLSYTEGTSYIENSASRKSSGDYLYLTNNMDFVLDRIHKREGKFFPGMKSQWSDESPVFETTPEGEKLLKIFDLEVMSDFQTPYMKVLAQNATIHGGNILNIGFGLGLVDSFIEKKRATRDIDEHHIVELNKGVFEKAKEWRDRQPKKEKIFLHLGGWEDVLPQLKEKGIVFDGVVYDAYPLEIDEICRDSIPFFYSLIKLRLVKEKTGILTFYFDSIDGVGEQFQQYLQTLGINEVQIKKIGIDLPQNRDCEHWDSNFFLAPLLTDIRYEK